MFWAWEILLRKSQCRDEKTKTKMSDELQNIKVALLLAVCSNRLTKAPFKHRVYLIFRVRQEEGAPRSTRAS